MLLVACYYFPNYHVDPRNEAQHGPGWTEWELVKDAEPRWPGHHQPKVPAWGYTDEADPEAMAQKIDEHIFDQIDPERVAARARAAAERALADARRRLGTDIARYDALLDEAEHASADAESYRARVDVAKALLETTDEAAINRDYPVMFGTLYFFTLLGLAMKLVEDLTYMAVDPRIDFESREV